MQGFQGLSGLSAADFDIHGLGFRHSIIKGERTSMVFVCERTAKCVRVLRKEVGRYE